MARQIPGINFNVSDSILRATEQRAVDAIINQFQAVAGQGGMYLELYKDRTKLDPEAESSSNALAEVNGILRDAPWYAVDNRPAKWYQRDRADDIFPIADGIAQPAYKPYYGEIVDRWDMKKFIETGFTGLGWDSVGRCWWICGGVKIVKVSEDFSESLGWWRIAGATDLQSVHVYDNKIYISDAVGPNGKISRHTLNSARTTVDSEVSGSAVTVTSSLLGDGTNSGTRDLTSDGTYIYVLCEVTDNVGRIAISTFAAWETPVDTAWVLGGTGQGRGVEYDGTDLWIGDYTAQALFRVKKDGSTGYNQIYAPNWSSMYALAVKDGDLYTVNLSSDVVEKHAIKNTRILSGQRIVTFPAPLPTPDMVDLCFVADLLGVGNDGYLTVEAGMVVRVIDDTFTEVTSGAIQSTTLTDGDSHGTTEFTAIDYNTDTDEVLLAGTGSTDDVILNIAIAEFDGAYTFVAGDVVTTYTAPNLITGLAKIPGEDNIVVIRSTTAPENAHEIDLSTGSKIGLFEVPRIPYGNDSYPLVQIAFDPNNPRYLYYQARGASKAIVIIDFALSRYEGTSEQPYTAGILGSNFQTYGITFNGDGDIVNSFAAADRWHVVAVASADDGGSLTGQGGRNIRYYGKQERDDFKTYPAHNYQSHSSRKVIRYRRKYDPSVYSDQHNVLPLDGLYIVTSTGFSIIDYETNSEFMTFSRPETTANMNMLCIGNSYVPQFRDIHVIDDMVFLSDNQVGFYAIDFKTDRTVMWQTAGLYESVVSIADRNYSSTVQSNIWNGTAINTNLTSPHNNTMIIHGKQDTTIDPKYHNGTETSLDPGEIYLAMGTTNGDGLVKWKAGVSYILNTTTSVQPMIADDFRYVRVFYRYSAGNASIHQFGDVRKIYADESSVAWATQTGETTATFNTSLANRYVNHIDVKTIWEEGIPYNYVAIAMGQPGTSDEYSIQIGDFTRGYLETLRKNTSSAGAIGVTWGDGSDVYITDSPNTGIPYLEIYTRKDYIAGQTYFWDRWQISENAATEYWQLSGADVNRVNFYHNTLCIAGGNGSTTVELPKRDSVVESIQEVSNPLDPDTCFMVTNQRISPTLGTHWRERRIFSDVNDSRFTFTDGSIGVWTYQENPILFGGNNKWTQGQSGGGTQPKVEWTTEDNCTEIYIYQHPDHDSGKVDINVTNTSGDIDIVKDYRSAEKGFFNIVVIKGLDAEAHDVTITARSDKNPESSNYYSGFSGCVEIVKTATAKAVGTIKHEVSFDGANNWIDITANDVDNKHTINPGHTPTGVIKKRTTFTVNDSDDMYVNDEAVIYE